jgi:hypothetical protein
MDFSRAVGGLAVKKGLFKCHFQPMLIVFALCAVVLAAETQDAANERTFPQTRAAIEKVMKTLQPAISGRLPALEGFAVPGERPLPRFQRGYYQCAVQIVSLPSGGSKVRVNTKITAWYADPVSTHSGYQTLPSNGRIETDLLDQIADALRASGPPDHSPPKQGSALVQDTSEAGISAPMPRIPESALHGSSVAPSRGTGGSLKSQTDAEEKRETELTAEAKGLEEILQNQAHPKNLVAIKKSGTAVMQSPNTDAKILFPATAEDEFEILDMNSNWVHIRISGLSRGWIRRSSLEMPEDFSGAKQTGAPSKNAAEEFRISKEQVAPFPGDWEPLRGKIVRIVTVQNASDSAKNPGAQIRLQFAKALFMKQYPELSVEREAPAGVVLIFDSDDGGMIAATLATLKEWQAGPESDDAMWRECFFDPPELSGK